tara:strand:+ start:3883 stop:4596 length:714 start_codon:yes stop_codon:yes gene_type:complete
MYKQNKTLNVLKVSALASFFEIIITQPLIYFKNISQINTKPILKNMYNGSMSSVSLVFVLNNIQIFSCKLLQNYSLHNSVVALISGGISSIIACPLEYFVICYQLKKNIIIPNLFRGLGMTCCRESLYTFGTLYLCPLTHNKIRRSYNISENISLLFASTISGTLSASLSHPFDTIKTYQQSNTKYILSHEQLKLVINSHGYKSLYNGLLFRSSKIVIANFILYKSMQSIYKNDMII